MISYLIHNIIVYLWNHSMTVLWHQSFVNNILYDILYYLNHAIFYFRQMVCRPWTRMHLMSFQRLGYFCLIMPQRVSKMHLNSKSSSKMFFTLVTFEAWKRIGRRQRLQRTTHQRMRIIWLAWYWTCWSTSEYGIRYPTLQAILGGKRTSISYLISYVILVISQIKLWHHNLIYITSYYDIICDELLGFLWFHAVWGT